MTERKRQIILGRRKMLFLLSGMFLCMTLLAIVSITNAKENEKKEKVETKNVVVDEATPTEAILANSHTITQADAISIINEFADANGIDRTEYSAELIKLLSRHTEAKDFVLNYPIYKDSKNAAISIDEEYRNGVPHFYQWDERWGYKTYGSGPIGLTGCGPTSLSMVAMYLLKKPSLTPAYMADYATKNGYCSVGNGTSWNFMTEGAEGLGLISEELMPNESVMAEKLREGKPIICVMGPGQFSDTGHYLVFTDYVGGDYSEGRLSGGYFVMKDPNCVENSEKQWKYFEFEAEINNVWCFSER